MRRGLIFGKFYPPHRGHKHLIESSAALCDQLTVLVMAADHETIPGPLRASWLTELHPNVRIIHTPYTLAQSWPDEDETSWSLFVEFVQRYHPEPLDIVFTSEWYGDSAARHLGCRHTSIDPNRNSVPISGTEIRSAPWRYDEFLEPVVKAHFIKRICIVGAESTGKTTLALQLARHFGTVFVPEYGRQYSDEVGHSILTPYRWTPEDFATIALRHHEHADQMAQRATHVIIEDTDALATEVWQERYLGFTQRLDFPRADLYLVTIPDLPFVQDGTRDGEHLRDWMNSKLIERLSSERLTFARVSGYSEERCARAVAIIQGFLAHQSL